MNTEWTLYAIILVLNTLACVSVAFLLARKQFVPGQFAMILLFIALSLWIFGYAMLLVSPTLEMKIFWLRVENLGIIPQSLFWFIFALQYSTQTKKFPLALIAALSITPILCLGFIFSDSWIHLYYPSITLLHANGSGPLKLERGLIYWVMFAQTYVLEFAALVLLLRRFLTFRNVYRRQMTLLIGAVFFPWVANIYFQVAPRLSGGVSTPIDLTPLTFAISAGLISAAVFGLKLFDLIPIARNRVLEYIPQMVFVVNVEGQILDINDTGKKWLGLPVEQIIGQPMTSVFQRWGELVERYADKIEARDVVKIPGNPGRDLEVSVFPVYNGNKLEGRAFVAHDITSRIQMEHELKDVNLSLQKQITEIASLRDKLEEQAIRDPLTGAYNRRYLADAIETEFALAEKNSTPLSVVILDVDHFKKFNDTYGHKCGDMMLQTLAKMLLTDSKRGDIVCRYGGEEFTIVMPNTSLQAAYARADKWRKAFSMTIVEFNGHLLSTTYSAGVACFPIHGADSETILHVADQALYEAKQNGRNQVKIYSI